MQSNSLQKVVTSSTMHYTPESEQLLPYYKYKCQQPNCLATFPNVGNYEMHLQRHHKLPAPSHNVAIKLYHCPADDCIYHYSKYPHGKSFKSMKYLRQHYQKVHAERPYSCENCNKRFTTEMQLTMHTKQMCGRRFVCSVCGWDYETPEALYTHAKRKGHVQADKKKRKNEQEIEGLEVEKVEVKEKLETKWKNRIALKSSGMEVRRSADMQDNGPSKLKRCRKACDASAQTDVAPTTVTAATNTVVQTETSTQFLDDEQLSLLRDIETQTEFSPAKAPEATPKTVCSSTSTSSDQMLAAGQSTHMHTQTACDDLFSDLGLIDIQTQTNWESPTLTSDGGGSGAGYAHDELFVSTETQTSFTQCLLEGESGAFGVLYTNTQHTQTCDTLLNGLFGAQEQNLIGGFQSSHTQT